MTLGGVRGITVWGLGFRGFAVEWTRAEAFWALVSLY